MSDYEEAVLWEQSHAGVWSDNYFGELEWAHGYRAALYQEDPSGYAFNAPAVGYVLS